MGAQSAIEWCHATFNPWWGCLKVSDGCRHCYAETLSKRFGHAIWGPAATTTRRTFGSKHWEEPLAWNAAAEREGVRKRVFCASMADVFEDNERLIYERKHLWQLIRRTPHLDWLLLTKRPGNICLMVPTDWLDVPPDNVWYGTSVENQTVEYRIYELARVPARVRFLSCEPLLGPLNIKYWLDTGALHWVITGGESGPKARPMHPGWPRSLRDQCQAAGVAFFHKQNGEWLHEAQLKYLPASVQAAVDTQGQELMPNNWFVRLGKKAAGRLLDGREWNEFPVEVAL